MIGWKVAELRYSEHDREKVILKLEIPYKAKVIKPICPEYEIQKLRTKKVKTVAIYRINIKQKDPKYTITYPSKISDVTFSKFNTNKKIFPYYNHMYKTRTRYILNEETIANGLDKNIYEKCGKGINFFKTRKDAIRFLFSRARAK